MTSEQRKATLIRLLKERLHLYEDGFISAGDLVRTAGSMMQELGDLDPEWASGSLNADQQQWLHFYMGVRV